ncbi:MAG: DUF72 domain-containing protein [Gemmatimonadetes bacterium]|nr:DUF72 domain-containing protein [Gemmatimonadota bacterium]
MAYVGISGYNYPNWRGVFYPAKLPARAWLAHASGIFNSIELNGTFYSLKSPAVFRRWAEETPDPFVFAVKGSRFITHNLKLGRAETALANFYASGVLALGSKTGPFLWQLPPLLRFDAERTRRFLELLPRDSGQAEALARLHDRAPPGGVLVDAPATVRFRHAFEVRHPSWVTEELYALLREHAAALVVADTADRFPNVEVDTTDFMYVRLHGSKQLYVSGYDDVELDGWAKRVRTWLATGRDVHVYFDNDARVHAPFDAQRLMERIRRGQEGKDRRG